MDSRRINKKSGENKSWGEPIHSECSNWRASRLAITYFVFPSELLKKASAANHHISNPLQCSIDTRTFWSEVGWIACGFIVRFPAFFSLFLFKALRLCYLGFSLWTLVNIKRSSVRYEMLPVAKAWTLFYYFPDTEKFGFSPFVICICEISWNCAYSISNPAPRDLTTDCCCRAL